MENLLKASEPVAQWLGDGGCFSCSVRGAHTPLKKERLSHILNITVSNIHKSSQLQFGIALVSSTFFNCFLWEDCGILWCYIVACNVSRSVLRCWDDTWNIPSVHKRWQIIRSGWLQTYQYCKFIYNTAMQTLLTLVLCTLLHATPPIEIPHKVNWWTLSGQFV